MMFRLCLLAILLHQVQCQEYLTCVRNNDAFPGLANQGTPSNNRGPIGYPGKKGVSGAKGGAGMKGSKGDVGETNLVAEERFRELQEMITNHTRMILALQRQTSQICPGWYHASNGYLYKLTTTLQTWQESREKCQEMGGDLAVVGMKDNNIRMTLRVALLQIQGNSLSLVWIGKSDIEQEGNWKWIDGSPINSPSGLWHQGEPNNFDGNEDCGTLNLENGLTFDAPCYSNMFALCEKSLTNACG